MAEGSSPQCSPRPASTADDSDYFSSDDVPTGGGDDAPHRESEAEISPEEKQRQLNKIEETINRTSFFQIHRDTLIQSLQLQEEEDPGMDFRIRLRLGGLLKCYEVQMILFAVVIVTFITTTVDADARANNVPIPLWVSIGSGVSVLLFTGECVVRVYVERGMLLKNPASLADVVVNFFLLILEITQYMLDLSEVQVLSIFRLFRLLRILKVASVYKHLTICKELSRILEMMGSCTRTLLWSSLFLYVTMHIWSTIAVVLIHPIVTDLSNEGYWTDCVRCRRSFSTVMDSNITFFQTIVAGDSWGLMAIPIIEHSPMAAFIMCGALFTLEYGLLQLIVCVIVDCFAEFRESDIRQRAIDKRSQELTEKRVLANIFQKIDTDFSGQVSLNELKQGAEVVPEFAQRLRVMDISNSDLKSLFEILDEDGSGELDVGEFIECFFRMMTAETKTAMAFTKSLARIIKIDQERIGARLDSMEKLFTRMNDFLGVPSLENTEEEDTAERRGFLSQQSFGDDPLRGEVRQRQAKSVAKEGGDEKQTINGHSKGAEDTHAEVEEALSSQAQPEVAPHLPSVINGTLKACKPQHVLPACPATNGTVDAEKQKQALSPGPSPVAPPPFAALVASLEAVPEVYSTRIGLGAPHVEQLPTHELVRGNAPQDLDRRLLMTDAVEVAKQVVTHSDHTTLGDGIVVTHSDHTTLGDGIGSSCYVGPSGGKVVSGMRDATRHDAPDWAGGASGLVLEDLLLRRGPGERVHSTAFSRTQS